MSFSYVYFNKHFHYPFPFSTFSNDLMKNDLYLQKRSTKTRQRLYNNYSNSFLRIDERKVRGEKIKSIHQPPSEYSKYPQGNPGYQDVRHPPTQYPEIQMAPYKVHIYDYQNVTCSFFSSKWYNESNNLLIITIII